MSAFATFDVCFCRWYPTVPSHTICLYGSLNSRHFNSNLHDQMNFCVILKKVIVDSFNMVNTVYSLPIASKR